MKVRNSLVQQSHKRELSN